MEENFIRSSGSQRFVALEVKKEEAEGKVKNEEKNEDRKNSDEEKKHNKTMKKEKIEDDEEEKEHNKTMRKEESRGEG